MTVSGFFSAMAYAVIKTGGRQYRVAEGETIDVYVHWQGQWTRTPAEAGVRERGHGMLRWEGVQSILLKGVEGDLPFGKAMRHTVPSTPRPGVVR